MATGYNNVTPDFFRKGVKNFFYNILFPVRFTGSLLQGKFERAGQETCRFIINSAVGLGGLMNPSSHYEWLNPSPEDTGQAMAKWGMGDGVYLVWPFLGASTLRDSVGMVADGLLYPFLYIDPSWACYPVKTYEKFNEWSFNVDAYEELKNSSIDPYSAVKDAYIQHRQKLVNE